MVTANRAVVPAAMRARRQPIRLSRVRLNRVKRRSMNSTAWPESMQEQSLMGNRNVSADSSRSGSEPSDPRLALLSQLEDNLRAGQQALLRRDLPRLEQFTRDQVVLM